MKKTAILCAVIVVALLSVVTVVCCAAPAPTPQPTPAPAPPPAPPVPSPTLESLTYTNAEYGFSVEYPKDWDVMEDYMGTVVAFMGPVVAEGAFMVNMSFVVEELAEEMTLKDYVRVGELWDKKTIANYNKVEEFSTTIGGLPANVQTITGTIKLDGEDLLLKDGVARFVKDKSGYLITYDVPEEFYDDYADCFELVINSFKFE